MREQLITKTKKQAIFVHNLLNDFGGLLELLRRYLEQEEWLNAYLIATGLNQIVEDYLHPDPFQLSKVAKNLALLHAPLGAISSRPVLVTSKRLTRLYQQSPTNLLLIGWQAEMAALVQQLARFTLIPPTSPAKINDQAETLLTRAQAFPSALLKEVVRLPSCFRSFDQHPDDLQCLAKAFAGKYPDRNCPLLVAGVRTSGSYLAPLLAAFLEQQGYRNVRTITVRPGRHLLKAEIDLLQDLRKAGGLLLLTDDPPTSGNSLAQLMKEFERLGLAPHRMVLLLQLFGEKTSLPAILQNYPSVLLPWPEWSIHQKLSAPHVQVALSALLEPAITPDVLEHLPLPAPKWNRTHTGALFLVQLRDSVNNRQWMRQIYVKGAGLGYFGEYSLAVARQLSRYLPKVYGLQDSLLYQAWLPEEHSLSELDPSSLQPLLKVMAAYVADRNRALPVEQDFSRQLAGQRPVWEAAGELLFQVYARVRPYTVPFHLLTHPVSRRLLRVGRPSVIDGSMQFSNWYAVRPQGLLKVDFDYRAFSNLDLYCYDPVYDLAGLAAALELASVKANSPENLQAQLLRSEYEALTGERVSEERWLLYRLVSLQDQKSNPAGEHTEIRRSLARTLQSYYASTFFKGLAPSSEGRLCALDIDGVLETDQFGVPALSPASASSLRALILHGYRPILATGRSLPEVRERCHNYHLSGGVAEYGSVLYNHQSGKTEVLLSASEQAELAQLRCELDKTEGVYLDPDYRFAVRAYRRDSTGHRCGLWPEQVATALERSGKGSKIYPIPGESQTDFMVVGVNKGTGLRALATELNPAVQAGGSKPFAFAVGDSSSDLPMFQLAELAFAPSHAHKTIRHAGVSFTRHSYQAGLREATAQLLGHNAGNCPICRFTPFSTDTQLLLELFSALDADLAGKARHALWLAFKMRNDRKRAEDYVAARAILEPVSASFKATLAPGVRSGSVQVFTPSQSPEKGDDRRIN
ncbi:MAG TPA: HAD hydrolase family protein [Chloroflexia bacterium]|nr:HAD hydrolase family protein [Chloroflexia bacterium]